MSRRFKFRQGLHPLYLPIYDFLCANLHNDWQPYRGMVTFEDQEGRYSIGRETRGKIVTHDKPGDSAFNYGCASAWTVFTGNKPIWDLHPHDWLNFSVKVDMAHGHWAGRHFRQDKGAVVLPMKSTWVDVNYVRRRDGFLAAEKYIERMHHDE